MPGENGFQDSLRYQQPCSLLSFASMKCPFCNHDDTPVLDTRISEEGDAIRRRRRCANCDKRFTTYERIELTMPVIVKKNGNRSEHHEIHGGHRLFSRRNTDVGV